VGLAYDPVLEDRILTDAAGAGTRRFRGKPLAIMGFLLHNLWRKFRGRFKGFGTAAAGFGPPVSLRAFLAEAPHTPTEALGAYLMAEITKVVPVLPVPLVAAALMEKPVDHAALSQTVTALQARLSARGAVPKLPPQGLEATLAEGLAPLVNRGLIDAQLQITPGSAALIGFYAAPVLQRLEPEM